LDVDWSPDGKLLISGSRDYKIKVWNSTTMAELMSWSDHNCVRSVDFHPTDELAATGGVDLTLKVRDLRTGTELKVLKDGMEQHAMVMSARWSPDGRMLASALGKSHTVVLYAFVGSGTSDGSTDLGPLTLLTMVIVGGAVTVVIFIPAFKELRRRRD
jgi:WD40 repeat protein